MSDAIDSDKPEPRMVTMKTLIVILTVCLSIPVGTVVVDAGIGWRALTVANESMRKTTNVEQTQLGQDKFFTAQFDQLKREMATNEKQHRIDVQRIERNMESNRGELQEFRKEVNANFAAVMEALREK